MIIFILTLDIGKYLDRFLNGGATVIATIMLAVSFVMLFAINGLQSWSSKRLGHV